MTSQHPTSRVEVRLRADALRLLERGLGFARLTPRGAEPSRVLAWTRLVLTEVGAIPPPGVLADLGWLVAGEPMRYGGHYPEPPPLAAAVRAYEDELLGRLAADPRLEDARIAIARVRADDRDRAIARFMVELLSVLRFAPSIALAPGALRPGRDGRAFEHAPGTGEPGLDPTRDDVLLADGYRALVQCARHTGQLISPALVFQLEHFARLEGAAGRLACSQAFEAAAVLERALPRRGARRAVRDASVATALDDESSFPAGGFAELSTQGSLENLVPSELIYMDPDRDGGIDWFDARYAEQALLTYARDEGLYTRPRRAIAFAFMPDLVRARVLDPGQRGQRLVLALALVRAVASRLVEALAEEALVIELLWIADATRESPLTAERGILEVLMAGLIHRGVVEIHAAPDLAAVRERAHEHTRRGASDLVVVSTAAATGPIEPGAVEHWLALGGPVPCVTGATVPPCDTPIDTWISAAQQLASALV